jgi:hypothetical protein
MPGTRFTEITDEQFDAANKRAVSSSRREQRAIVARYDSRSGKVVVIFASGIELRIPPKAVQALERARACVLRRIEISPSGQGIHFPAIDADVFLPALLAGQTGTRAWMAAQIGRAGGKAISHAKITAARANGRKGGRPRRPASPSP